MPYIPTEHKHRISHLSILNLADDIKGPADLSYVISQLIVYYVQQRGKCWATLKDVDGVLDTLNKELYRRVTGPYEDRKAEENGDVFAAIAD